MVDQRAMNAPPNSVIITTASFLAACVASDVRTLRIPNAYTFPAMLGGMALNSWAAGWPGLAGSIAGTVLAIGVLVVPFALGGIGAGDVKMMGAVGALLGPRLMLSSLLAGMMLGGLLAATALMRRGKLAETLSNVGGMAMAAITQRSLSPLRMSASSPGAVIFPYSVPLAFGTLAVITVSRISL